MATRIYQTEQIALLDNSLITLEPLKLKFLREFMDIFDTVKESETDDEAIDRLVDCVVICMKQFCPNIATRDDVEDLCSLAMIYKIIDVAASINLKEDSEQSVKQQAESNISWEDFDLIPIESEIFLLGGWKNYDDLESSLSMPEIVATLTSKRELDYNEKKFFAAIQGVDLDKNNEQENAWERLKTKVFSGGATNDPKDILALQGRNAQMAGFGIGQGLSYEKWD